MFLNIASNGVTYIGEEIVFKNMIIHQQSIIDLIFLLSKEVIQIIKIDS